MYNGYLKHAKAIMFRRGVEIMTAYFVYKIFCV